jgi:16S rRNA (uracil1498-N3)-methyltransferase
MGVTRLFCGTLEPGEVSLAAEEARHGVAARRLREGDRVVLFDGRGGEAEATLVRATSTEAVARIEAIRRVERRGLRRLTLAVAMPKQARQDTLIEKCTELGVAAMRPIETERTVAEVGKGRLERWRRVAIAAAKQSGQAWLPEFAAPASLTEVLRDVPRFDLAVVADPGAGAEGLLGVLGRLSDARSVLALVGPEGGFTEGERQRMLAAGAVPCRVAASTLRVETAAIAAAAIILAPHA